MASSSIASLSNVASTRSGAEKVRIAGTGLEAKNIHAWFGDCLLYTSDAADDIL
jgi:hypothetical protein